LGALPAVLAYAVAYAYGKSPTQKQFELHLLKLLSGVTWGAISGGSNAKDFGNKARDFYNPSTHSINHIRP